jgi:hypothetical protein
VTGLYLLDRHPEKALVRQRLGGDRVEYLGLAGVGEANTMASMRVGPEVLSIVVGRWLLFDLPPDVERAMGVFHCWYALCLGGGDRRVVLRSANAKSHGASENPVALFMIVSALRAG